MKPSNPEATLQKVWGTARQAVDCLACGVIHLLPAEDAVSRCPACLSERLQPHADGIPPEPPQKLIPFATKLSDGRLAVTLSEWLQHIRLAPADLCVDSLLARRRRVYWPMWMVEGTVIGTWQAQMGFEYQVESSKERFRDGQGWSTQHLTETKVRWEPRAGCINRTYQDLTLPALDAQEQAQLDAYTGGYDVSQAVDYDHAAMAEATVRVPSLTTRETLPLAETALHRLAVIDCQQAAGAQHHQAFTLEADYCELKWGQLLLPLYVTYYEDDSGQPIPVWINGQNGHVDGIKRASWRKGWRITRNAGIIAALVFLTGVLLALWGDIEAGSVLMTLGFLAVIVAVLPVLWVWQFNQRQRL